MEVLAELPARIRVRGTPHACLLPWAQAIDAQQLWAENVGAVSFAIGSPVRAANKVFAATEVSVLARNPNVDATTRDLVTFFQRCIRTRQDHINFGFIAG